jgi:hypothetical protein
MPAEKSKPLQVMAVLQKGGKQHFVEMNNITIHRTFKMPAVHLAGRHKIDLPGLYGELRKVQRMRAFPFCKKQQVVKIMPVLLVHVLVIPFEISRQPFREHVLVLVVGADGADIIYRDSVFHDNTKVRRTRGAANDSSGVLWYFLLIMGKKAAVFFTKGR